MSNYPAGVKDSDFDEPKSKVSVTVEIDSLIYDNGYGDKDATLVVDCTVSNNSEIRIDSGTYFLIGNNGVELGEAEYDEGSKPVHDQLVYKEALRLALKEID